jgi:signal peptidase II
VLSTVALVAILVLFWRDADAGRWTRLALAGILAGAAGNLYDRLAYGYVVDFLDFYVGSLHWPAFNVADSAITVGAGLLLLDALRKPEKDAAARAAA